MIVIRDGYKPHPHAVSVGNPTTSGPINSSRCCLVGWALYETTGVSPASIQLRDATDTGGLLVAPILFNAGQSTRDWFGPYGIEMTIGLWETVVSGSVGGSVFVRFQAHAE